MITFSHIYQRYPESDHDIFHDFSEEIKDGEFILLTGKSGIGKTTLIRMLLKEIEPDSGRILVGGEDLSQIARNKVPYYRRRIGVIFQDFRLMEERTVYDNLFEAVLMTGGNRKDAEVKIARVLSMLGIDGYYKRYPTELSGGEQQIVCLARAVINHPRLLLADEPAGHLDPTSTRELIRLMELVRNHGVTVVMATHDAQTVKDMVACREIALDQSSTEM